MSKYNFEFLEKKLAIYGKNKELNIDYVKISDYLKCVENWGKTHNINSSNMTAEELIDNINDSVIGGCFLSLSERVCDAGSGGGLPGIPLAIVYPKNTFYLVESNRKKCSFLRMVKIKLNLPNIIIQNSRIEQLEKVDFIVSKAAFSPQNIDILVHALSDRGKLALWATQKNYESFKEILEKLGLSLEHKFDYDLPHGKKRCVLLFTKNA